MSWPEPWTAGLAGLAIAAALAGCGLEPVHARRASDGGSVVAALAQVEVAPIPDRIGLLLRRRLQERLAPGGPGANGNYRLEVRLRSSKASALVGKGDTTTRADLTVTAEFELWRLGAERPVFRSWAQSVHSHDVLASAFATRAAERAARERGVDALSAQIARRLALFFRQRAKAG